MTAEHYHALYRWFDAHSAARRFVVALDRWLPLVPFVCYPVLLCLLNVRLVQLFLTRQSAPCPARPPPPLRPAGFHPAGPEGHPRPVLPVPACAQRRCAGHGVAVFLPGCRLVHDRHRPAHCRGAGAHRRAPYPGCGRRACPRVCLRLCRHVAAVTAPHKNPKLFSNCS